MVAVNTAFGTSRWQPVLYLREHREPADIAAMYAADVCVVLSSLLNLVAKEFIVPKRRARRAGPLALYRRGARVARGVDGESVCRR